jgi:hypothetical protein
MLIFDPKSYICSVAHLLYRTLEHEAKRGHRSSIKQYKWLEIQRAISIDQPVPSPQIYGYRNKVEFTAGYKNVRVDNETNDNDATKEVESMIVAGKETTDEDDTKCKGVMDTSANNIKKVPAAGFLAAGWSGGVTSPHCLQNTPDWACAIADILNDYLPTSPLKPYDSKVSMAFTIISIFR